MAATGVAPVGERNWRRFVLACVTLGGMGQGVVAPRLPQLLAGASRLALASGASATLMYLGVFAATFRFGRWADRGRAHWLLGPGLFLYSITLIALGAGLPPWALALLRFVEGLALAAIYVAADFVLGRQSPSSERGRWLSYYGVALSVGLLLGPLLSLASARLPGAWGASAMPPLGACALTAAVLGLAALRGLRIAPAPESADRLPRPRPLNPSALIAGGAYGYMEAALVAVFPVLAVRTFGVPPEAALCAVIVSAAVFSLVWGTLSDRLSPARVTGWLVTGLATLPLALALAAAAHLPGPALAYSSCAVYGCLAGGLYPVGFAWLLESQSEAHYGQASGAFARAYGLGSLLGPAVAGLAAEWAADLGLHLAIAAAGALALVRILARGAARTTAFRPPSGLR